jgi:L-asparaginase
VDFVSLPEPIDSCNMTAGEWKWLAQQISDNYRDYNGFVILHGTDSMVYTASILSFMLENLSKPVVLTGAQRSHLFNVRNDAEQNIVSAVQIANAAELGLPIIQEVVILFGTDILRGNRTRKKDANGYLAYESPRYPLLGKAGANLDIYGNVLLHRDPIKRFILRSGVEPNVAYLHMIPGIQNTALTKRVLGDSTLKGVVCGAFGAGNIPTAPDYLGQFKSAIASDHKVVQAVTQCTQGGVELGLYETSNLLIDIGFVSGTDLTPEAALCKMMVALGNEDLTENADLLREYLQTSVAGEQSISIYEMRYSRAGDVDSDTDFVRRRVQSDQALSGQWVAPDISAAQLRFYGATITGLGADASVEIGLYANLASTDALNKEQANFCGLFSRRAISTASVISFDVTRCMRGIAQVGRTLPFTVTIEGGTGKFAWSHAELAIFVRS